MPFDTVNGPAVLVENICNPIGISERLGVHVNAVYGWIRNKERNKFPEPLPCGERHYDYAEIYTWFQEWVKKNKAFYPTAFADLYTEVPA